MAIQNLIRDLEILKAVSNRYLEVFSETKKISFKVKRFFHSNESKYHIHLNDGSMIYAYLLVGITQIRNLIIRDKSLAEGKIFEWSQSFWKFLEHSGCTCQYLIHDVSDDSGGESREYTRLTQKLIENDPFLAKALESVDVAAFATGYGLPISYEKVENIRLIRLYLSQQIPVLNQNLARFRGETRDGVLGEANLHAFNVTVDSMLILLRAIAEGTLENSQSVSNTVNQINSVYERYPEDPNVAAWSSVTWNTYRYLEFVVNPTIKQQVENAH